MSIIQKIKRLIGINIGNEAVLQSCFSANYLVIDLELTGLDQKKDEIVSLAWVPIKQQRIYLGKGEYHVNSQVTELKQSPIFHGIDTKTLHQGKPLNMILEKLKPLLENSILIFHNAELDWPFLIKAFHGQGINLDKEYHYTLLDTLKIEHRRLQKQGQEIRFDALNLANCRNRYNLPDHHAHNALTDAIATAELFLAQINHISKGRTLLIKHLT
jgi:DNA polymerase-3 subunit epsilon